MVMFYGKTFKTPSECLLSSSSFTTAFVRQRPASFLNSGLGFTRTTVPLGKLLCCKEQDRFLEVFGFLVTE